MLWPLAQRLAALFRLLSTAPRPIGHTQCLPLRRRVVAARCARQFSFG